MNIMNKPTLNEPAMTLQINSELHIVYEFQCGFYVLLCFLLNQAVCYQQVRRTMSQLRLLFTLLTTFSVLMCQYVQLSVYISHVIFSEHRFAYLVWLCKNNTLTFSKLHCQLLTLDLSAY